MALKQSSKVLDLALETIADDEQDLNLIQIRDSRQLDLAVSFALCKELY